MKHCYPKELYPMASNDIGSLKWFLKGGIKKVIELYQYDRDNKNN